MVVDEVVTLVEETVIMAEAEMREGATVKTPTNTTKTGRKRGEAVRTVGKEVGWRRNNHRLGDGGKDICEAMPSRRS